MLTPNVEIKVGFDNVRIFRGDATRQRQYNGEPADPELWYYEPSDYDGDVVWSTGYGSYADAYHACGAGEECCDG
jgi:hypothetical protein